MSNNPNQSSEQNLQSQPTPSDDVQSSASEGQKRSAPEHPPATPVDQRSNSANFGEDTEDIASF
jgi:hypothetical protein